MSIGQFWKDYGGDAILMFMGLSLLVAGLYTITTLQPTPSNISSPFEQVYYPLGYAGFLLGFTLTAQAARDYREDKLGKKRQEKFDQMFDRMVLLETKMNQLQKEVSNIPKH